MICNAALKVFLVVLILCVGFSVQDIEVSKAERIHDFRVTPTKDAVSWRAFGREWTVQLSLSQVMEDNEDYFHGTLVGDETAVVSFSLLPGLGLSGMIATHNETWWITARGKVAHDEDARTAVWMYKESNVLIDETLVPALHNPLHTEEDSHHQEDQEETEGGERKRAVTAYKVAVYVDQKWTTASNNPWSSQADTIGLMNDVNAIYKASGLGQFTVKYQKQITNTYSNPNDILSYFSDTQGATLSTFKDTSYTNQMWLVGSNVGGLAYVGTTCKASQNMNRKTAIAGLANFSRLYTVKTIAHELGHNRGANHDFTNQCSGTTTKGCQCSVMSYCYPTAANNPGGAKNTFSTTSINEMRNAGCY
jgi:hypothetical protein